MNEINPAIMCVLPPGQVRHYVCPVYVHRGVYFCLTEMSETDPHTGVDDYFRIFEAFTEEELYWLNANCTPAGCSHELLNWMYWQDWIAFDLVQRLLEDQERDLFDSLDKSELRADLDKELNNILGR